MSALTKAQIIAGSLARETVTVEGLGDVVIRPLTDGEWSEVEMCTLRALRIGREAVDKAKGDDTEGAVKSVLQGTDLSVIAEAQLEAARLTVAYGLSVDETWTVEDVKQLRAGTIHFLAKRINKLTGADTTYADLVPFREESARRRDRSRAGDGTPPGTDAAGTDEATG